MSTTPAIGTIPTFPAIDPTQPVFLRVPVKCLRTIIDALLAAGFSQEANEVQDFTHAYTDPAANAERQRWLNLAEETVAKDGEIEFDADATISHSTDNGEYVLGWIWVDAAVEAEEAS